MKSVLLLSFKSTLVFLFFFCLVGCGVKKPPLPKSPNPMVYERYIKRAKYNSSLQSKSQPGLQPDTKKKKLQEKN